MTRPIRVFMVDDEELALRRLRTMLDRTGRVEVVGAETQPARALAALAEARQIDVVFLDIEMPGMKGLELAARLPVPPWVVFVTAHDHYALRAFEVAALDYVVKPVSEADLARALDKVERVSSLEGGDARAEATRMLERIERALRKGEHEPERIALRAGERLVLVEVARVTHFRAENKLTFATVDAQEHEVDASLSDLESRFGATFFRIHRGTLVNVAHVREIDARATAGTYVRLGDASRTELLVSRDRVRALRERLGV